MARLIWTGPALQDLDEIAEYIAMDKPLAASRLVKMVFTKVKRLEQFPESGKRPRELYSTPYKELVVPPCRIFYRIEGSRVYIMHVMRSERLLIKFLLKERDRDI